MQLISVESLFLRGRAALAFATQHGPRAPERARLVTCAERDARAIDAERMPYATPLASLLRAGAHALRGQMRESAALSAAAARAFDDAGMALFATAARRRHGEIVGGSEGAGETADADAWMRAQEVVNPTRMTALLAPGFAVMAANRCSK